MKKDPTPVQDYVNQKLKLLHTPFIIKPCGEGFYLDNGIEVPEKEFLRENQAILVPLQKENVDRTKNWFNNKKSY